MTSVRPAPLQPKATRVWIVRWVRADGRETRHRVYLREHEARQFYSTLLADGRTAGIFSSPTCWTPGN